MKSSSNQKSNQYNINKKMPNKQQSSSSIEAAVESNKINSQDSESNAAKVTEATNITNEISDEKLNPDLESPKIDTSITVQVYNLKQNLTKQMLSDLLKPHVASIDFKTKSISSTNEVDSSSSSSSSSSTSVSSVLVTNNDNNNVNSFINEENEEVFIKFESKDKLNQVFKLFNLNEGIHSTNTNNNKNSNDDNNNNQESESTSNAKKKDSPFLLRQLTIY